MKDENKTKSQLIKELEELRAQYDNLNSNCSKIAGQSENSSESKTVEELLKESEEISRIFMNAITESAFLIDTKGRLITANKTFFERFNKNENEISDIDPFDILPPEVAQKRRELTQQAINTKKTVRFEDTRWGRVIDNVIYPVLNDKGEVYRLAILGRDITDRLQYEQKLKELNADKDKFFSIIAHDLKSPFTALLGFSEYMAHYLEDLSPDEIKDFAMNIFKSASGVYRLIENLLQWSRLQLGRMEFAPINFDFNELADDMLQLYQANAIKKKVHLVFDLEPGLRAFADKNMIETVIRNLLSNAMKFTNAGGIVRMCARKKENFIDVSIIDNGVGINEDDLPKLFKVGERFSTKGTDQEKGTGLGLLLCKEFIEKNGGRISVSSTPLKGSSFTFTLPVKNSR